MTTQMNKLTLAALALTLTAVAGSSALACGRGGGGYRGPSSPRLSIAYNRSAPHMQSHAPRHSQPRYTQPTYQPPVYQHPVYRQPIAPQPVQTQPVQVLPQQQVVPQPVQQPQASNPATAEQSALEALASLNGAAPAAMPQFAPATPAAQPTATAGVWTATLAGGASVRLELKGDGKFLWIANSGGKMSSFEGVFTLSGGRLTLIRTGDNQQLAGAWIASASGAANFKLDGDTAGGLNFIRG